MSSLRKPRLLCILGLAILMTFQVAYSAWGAGNETINTVPATNSSFMSQLTTFLRNELANITGRLFQDGYVRSGGTHATAGTCTSAAFATEAWTIAGSHVTADSAGGTASINYSAVGGNCANPGSDVCWTAITGASGGPFGNFQRSGTSNYIVDCVSATLPTTPADSIMLMKVAITNGAIATVTPLSARTTPAPLKRVLGWVNVKDYGATGDGVTDDTQAILEAVAELPATGGTIVFPHGTYLVSSTISFKNLRNIRLMGTSLARRSADSQSSTIQYTAAAGSLFTLEGTVGWELDGINLTYSHAAYASIFIDLDQGTGSQNTSEISFRNSRIGGLSTSSKAATMLVRVAELVYDINFDHCIFVNGAVAIHGALLNISNANDIKITNNLFLTTFSDTHIKAGGQAWIVQNNTFEPATALVASGFDVTAIGLDGLMYSGNGHGDATSGTWFKGTGGVLRGASITGNEFQGTGTTVGIDPGAALGFSITGNLLKISGTAINLSAGVSECAIRANRYVSTTRIANISSNLGANCLAEDLNTSRLIYNGVYDNDRANTAQTTARIRARNQSTGNTFEWGISNAAGFAHTLGVESGNGKPVICFNCEAGTNASTYRTRGNVGRVIQSNNAGALVLGTAANANADNQALTTDFTFSATGQLSIVGQAFASLGTPANGTVTFCTDCAVTGAGDNTCAAAGAGALAVRIGGVWRCFNLQN